MKSIGKFVQSNNGQEVLKSSQIQTIKGGDDKRPPRPGGGTGGIPPNPLPNSTVPGELYNSYM